MRIPDGYGRFVEAGSLPLLERALEARDSGRDEAGAIQESIKIMFLMTNDVTAKDIEVLSELDEIWKRNSLASRWQAERLALLPYVGKQIVYAGVWSAGMQYFLYIDRSSAAIVHCKAVKCPDPDETGAVETDSPRP